MQSDDLKLTCIMRRKCSKLAELPGRVSCRKEHKERGKKEGKNLEEMREKEKESQPWSVRTRANSGVYENFL